MTTVTTKGDTEIYKEWGAGQPVVFSPGWPHKANPSENERCFGRGCLRLAITLSAATGASEPVTVDLAEVRERLIASNKRDLKTPAFEFHRWIAFSDSREREALTLRFIEDCEYHEIAAVQTVLIGAAKSRVFNAEKRLAPPCLMKTESNVTRKVVGESDEEVIKWGR